MKTSYGSLLLVVLVWSLSLFGGVNGIEEIKCPPCRYEKENEPGCYSYSQTSSRTEMKAWEPADEFCLASLGIELRILKLDIFWAICPYANETDVNYSEMQNFLKNYPDHPISREIKELFADRGIFVLNAAGDYVLPESITTASNQAFINCTFSQQLCWGEVRVELKGRIQKIRSLCKNLHSRQSGALQLEQAKTRENLCDVATTVAACGTLHDAIQAYKPFGGDCTFFDDIIPNSALPVCGEILLLDTSAAARPITTATVISGLASVALALVALIMV